MNDIEYSSFLQFQTDTPPMDLMLTNHEYEIYKMMGVPGVVMMNYRFEETPYSPSDWWLKNINSINQIGKNVDDYVLKHNYIICFSIPKIYFEMNFIPVNPAGKDEANNHAKAII